MEPGKKGAVGARAVRAADLVAYQGGAVVSREILHQKSGTVTLFAFDEAQGLSEHTAPYDALVYLLDGEAEITIAGEAQRVREGEMILLPARQPHALRAVRPFKMVLTMLRTAPEAAPAPGS